MHFCLVLVGGRLFPAPRDFHRFRMGTDFRSEAIVAPIEEALHMRGYFRRSA